MYDLVEPARALDGWIQNALEVGGPDHDYLVVGLESVHFRKNLVYSVARVRRVK
jgi:hypothetical protein